MATILDTIRATVKLEGLKFNTALTPEQKEEQSKDLLAVVEPSLEKLAEMVQESVNNRQEINDLFNQAGIDPVALRRDAEVNGAQAVINAIQQAEQAE